MSHSFMDSLPEGTEAVDTFLREKGYDCVEENTADSNRWRYYIKRFEKYNTNMRIDLVLRFELSISDDPYASWSDNCSLFFSDTFIEIYDRQMERDGTFMGEPSFDEDTELPRRLGRYEVRLTSIEAVEAFAEAFK